MDEQVLVVPAEALFEQGEWLGFQRDLGAFRRLLERPDSFEFRSRGLVETDPSVKQLIPYAIIRRRGDVFTYRRGAAGGEKRLHESWSIGVGGHVCREDGDAIEAAYQTGFLRELDEEVEISGGFSHRVVGLLYDPRTAVGTVHVGVVHVVDVDEDVKARDPSLVDAGFRSLDELASVYHRMESWSQFVFDPLTKGEL